MFDQDFPITTSAGEGQNKAISYNPQVHGDPLLYPEAFEEVPRTKVQGAIVQMEPDQLQQWSQHYLFQELLGEITNVRGMRTGSSEEDSDEQSTVMSQRMVQGSQSDLTTASAPGRRPSGSVAEVTGAPSAERGRPTVR